MQKVIGRMSVSRLLQDRTVAHIRFGTLTEQKLLKVEQMKEEEMRKEASHSTFTPKINKHKAMVGRLLGGGRGRGAGVGRRVKPGR